ncbi:hypothetical protein PARPLA_01645 [Rhodobacteraceae bacterium THAF1]|uniref:hypothetical protein n=1 Tax=Palleronia sp. THAF1 TaxID=2587842 RepID=UPI000F3E8F03|nr:hypothetical protein [Palleronia sp. THAF1]QFU07729.1 hypothetical protein FIU81_03470 [Palleronia sp. THAF1]VDC23209.1 hypothetical protein PARPLA_01645 [Rhodobacteraceae bacterium THAF1]
MIRHRTPILMGLVMGLAMPWMMHVDGGGAAFVLVHILLIVTLGGLALLLPGLRRKLHRPNLRHITLMLPAAAAAWGLTCLYCLAVSGQHWS